MVSDEEQYPARPVFKGLQKPLEFMGLKGRYITWAAIAVGIAFAGFIIGFCVSGMLTGIIMLAIALAAGAGFVFFRQTKGLHTKKADKGVFVYKHTHSL